MSINYVNGDAACPIGDGNKLICHVVNSIGAWGAGFVMAISKRWSAPETAYREWHRNEDGGFGMGRIQCVQVTNDIYVVNMVAQHSIRGRGGSGIPLRYPALKQCLQRVAELAKTYRASVHAPRIGCGLAGGMWEHVQDIIEETLILEGVKVTVYDFDG